MFHNSVFHGLFLTSIKSFHYPFLCKFTFSFSLQLFNVNSSQIRVSWINFNQHLTSPLFLFLLKYSSRLRLQFNINISKITFHGRFKPVINQPIIPFLFKLSFRLSPQLFNINNSQIIDYFLPLFY